MAHPTLFRNHHGIQFRQCEHCNGGGSIDRNDSNPHGYGPDPQQGYEVRCPECFGDGDFRVTPVDTLELLALERSLMARLNGRPHLKASVRRRYDQRRAVAMQRVDLPKLPANAWYTRLDPIAAEVFAPVFRAMGFAA